MATNEILAFCSTDTGTNLLTQSEYAADSQRSIGNQPGVARSKLVNKTLKQTSLVSAALAQYIANNQATDVTDSLSVSALAALIGNVITGSQNAGLYSVNLKGTAPGSAKTASWTVDEITAETALGGTIFKGTSLSLSFDGSTTGANGMDTGSTPTSSSLYVYAIYNPTTNTWSTLGTVAGSGAYIYGGSNMPSGYTASALIWSGVTNGSGQIGAFSQLARNIKTAAVSVISGGSATSYTNLSISSAVPANAKMADGYFTNPSGVIDIASSTAGIGQIETQAGSVGAMAPFSGLHLITAQNISYKVSSGTGAQIWVSGYSI